MPTPEEKITMYEPIRQALTHEPGWRTLVVAGVDENGSPFVWLFSGAGAGPMELIGLTESLPDNVRAALSQAEATAQQQARGAFQRPGIIKPT